MFTTLIAISSITGMCIFAFLWVDTLAEKADLDFVSSSWRAKAEIEANKNSVLRTRLKELLEEDI